MLGGLADYHRKHAAEHAAEAGEMPAVGEGHQALFEFFTDDDAPPPVARRLSVNQGVEALDVQHVQPKPIADHRALVVPAAAPVVVAKAEVPAAPVNKRISIHHISPPTTASANQRRRSTTTISTVPIKKRPSLILRCCQLLVFVFIVGLLLVLGGMLLEAKVLHFFHSCNTSDNGHHTTSPTSGALRDRQDPSPFCPFGSAMLSTTTGNQSTHVKALQIIVVDEFACRNECQSIPSCERAVFVGAEGNKCYLEMTDAVDSSGQYMTCLKSRNQALNCPSNMPCKGWIKMCQCPQLEQNIDYATTKTLLDDVSYALQCTSIDIDGEDYLFGTCVPTS